jgi:glycosyltransferase involved in cell wall biosynthesis
VNRTILVTFTQLPQEPSSGAARSIRTICEFLASGGWRVQVLGSTATEGLLRLDAPDLLRTLGIETEIASGPQSSRVIRFRDRGVAYVLLDVGSVHVLEARQSESDAYDQLFDSLLEDLRPGIFLTYGGWAVDRDRRCRAQSHGTRVVFTIRNEAFMQAANFIHVDTVFSSSAFLTERYRSTIGIDSTPLPVPVAARQVVPAYREPTFVTFVNPEPLKGVALFARIAEEVSSRHPEIPFLIVKSRTSGQTLINTGLAGGFDLGRHRNIVLANPVSEPSRIYGVTRILLVPSLIEASGRVAAEALLNGIPVIASDRGGLPETLRGGGFVLPLPADMDPSGNIPPSAEAMRLWIDLTIRLMIDGVFYQESTRRALKAGGAYSEDGLVSAYCRYFEKVLGADCL